MKRTLSIGTCSWKYPSWETLVYEAGSSESYLSQYARRYCTVEVDQWFWSLGKERVGLPDPEVVNAYARETDEEFRFTIKAPNALTAPFAYGSKSEVLAPPFDDYTDLLLSSVPEMEIGWLEKAIGSRRMASAGN